MVLVYVVKLLGVGISLLFSLYRICFLFCKARVIPNTVETGVFENKIIQLLVTFFSLLWSCANKKLKLRLAGQLSKVLKKTRSPIKVVNVIRSAGYFQWSKKKKHRQANLHHSFIRKERTLFVFSVCSNYQKEKQKKRVSRERSVKLPDATNRKMKCYSITCPSHVCCCRYQTKKYFNVSTKNILFYLN